MSDRPIRVGDLVVQIKTCCEPDEFVGIPFVVEKLVFCSAPCSECGDSYSGLHVYEQEDEDWFEAWIPIHWLKRIPPLSELESEKSEDCLTV